MTIFKLPRLSVDIDLDFTEILTSDEIKPIREAIRNTVRLHTKMNGYNLTDKSKEHHTLDSDVYEFVNSAGVKDNLKIEINYSLRSHIFPLVKRPIETLGVFTPTTVLSLDPIEIFASKISALLARVAVRDLYDVNNMVSLKLFDNSQIALLQKCLAFYIAVGAEAIPEAFSFDKIDALTYQDFKKRLKPMLRKKDSFDLNSARENVKEFLSKLLVFSEKENLFLSSFSDGKYIPELLFDGEELERVRNHPMAAWKMIVHERRHK